MIECTAQNPFERFADGRPKVPDGADRARPRAVGRRSLRDPAGKGFRNQYEDGFQVLHPDKKLVGRAFTVQFMPVRPDLDAVINAKAKAAGLDRMYNQVAIDMLQPGDVLVVDLFGKTEGGTIVGDNLFYYVMKATKGAGLVVDGSIRDLDGISQMDMPAYFRRAHPSAISNVIISGINVPVRIGNATVMPGDLVVRRLGGRLLHSAGARAAGRGQRRRDPHPRRVDAEEVRRRQVQVERDLRLAEGPGAEERIRGVPEEAPRRDPQEVSEMKRTRLLVAVAALVGTALAARADRRTMAAAGIR